MASTTQTLRQSIASNHALRAIALPILRKIDIPIAITNPYARQRFRLLSFTHKGYWFYGKEREAATMQRFAALVRPGDTVLEIGGHIGFVTQFFARLVGQNGDVHVFEPGQRNARYLSRNIAACGNVRQLNMAVSDTNGTARFYEENLGGFMNSLHADYVKDSNVPHAQQARLKLSARDVKTTTVDTYCQQQNLRPNFMKIDVEGAELAALNGAARTLTQIPHLMVEVTRNAGPIFDLLSDAGFALTQEDGTIITQPTHMRGNVFASRWRRHCDPPISRPPATGPT